MFHEESWYWGLKRGVVVGFGPYKRDRERAGRYWGAWVPELTFEGDRDFFYPI